MERLQRVIRSRQAAAVEVAVTLIDWMEFPLRLRKYGLYIPVLSGEQRSAH